MVMVREWSITFNYLGYGDKILYELWEWLLMCRVSENDGV